MWSSTPEVETHSKSSSSRRNRDPSANGGPLSNNINSQSSNNAVPNDNNQPANIIFGPESLNALTQAVSQAVATALQHGGTIASPVNSIQQRRRLSKVVKHPIQKTKDPIRTAYTVGIFTAK